MDKLSGNLHLGLFLASQVTTLGGIQEQFMKRLQLNHCVIGPWVMLSREAGSFYYDNSKTSIMGCYSTLWNENSYTYHVSNAIHP